MLLLAFALPLATVVACLALNRAVASRWLAAAGAAALLGAALILLGARLLGSLPIVILDYTWLELESNAVQLLMRLDAVGWPFALLALLGGALALLALAAALPQSLRGFGGLVATLLIAPVITVTGIANTDPLLLPFAWVAAALASFAALRISGALAASAAPLTALVAGLAGALLAFAAAVALRGADPAAEMLVAGLVAASVLALLALGAAPLHTAVSTLAEAPAALAAALVALGLPLLGGYTLIDFAIDLGPAAPSAWRTALVAAGVLTLLVCGAGALRTTRMRQIAGWQLSAQGGCLLVAAGVSEASLALAAPLLLANLALTTLAAFLALAALERRAGTDDLTALGESGPFLLAGLAVLIAGASAVGVPGTLGSWGKLWLVDELRRGAPWAVPLLLAGSSLLAFGYVAPVAAFWRRGSPDGGVPAELRSAGVLAAVPAAVLLVGALVPGPLWQQWLAGVQRALAPDVAPEPPRLPGLAGLLGVVLAAALLVIVPLAGTRTQGRRKMADPEMGAEGVIPPAALGESLRGIAMVGAPDAALLWLYELIQQLSAVLSRLLALFERRYYLAGLLIAMIVVILIFI